MELPEIREDRVQELLAAKAECDAAGGTDADGKLLGLVRDSTGYEINEAMDRSGQGTESWSRIKGR